MKTLTWKVKLKGLEGFNYLWTCKSFHCWSLLKYISTASFHFKNEISDQLMCGIKLNAKIMTIVFFLGWWDSIFYLLWPTFGCFGNRADNQKVWKPSRSLNIFHTADIKRVIMISFQFGNIQLEFVYQCRQNFWIQRNASIATKLEFTKS